MRRCCKQEEQSPAQPSPARPHLPPRGAAHQPSPPPRAQPQHTRYLWTDIWTLAGVVRAGDAAPCPANCCSVPASGVGGAGRGCAAGGVHAAVPGSGVRVSRPPPCGGWRRRGVTRVCGLGPPSYVQRTGGQNTPGTTTTSTPPHQSHAEVAHFHNCILFLKCH